MDSSTWNSFASWFEMVAKLGVKEAGDTFSIVFVDPQIVSFTFCIKFELLRLTMSAGSVNERRVREAPDTIILKGTPSASRNDKRQRKLRTSEGARLTSRKARLNVAATDFSS
jgi:hypothetical protein